MKTVTIEEILNSENGTMLLYRAIRGSHAFGLATEKSDIDEIWVYAAPIENCLDLGEEYQNCIENETHDILIYEIGRFVELLAKSNPTCLESLHIPEDCVLYVHPLFQVLIDMRDIFLTQKSFKPYVGYAKNQIDKARGLNKAISKDPVEKRLTILDFCYVPRVPSGSTKIMNWLEYRNLKPKYCGAANIPNMYNMADIYYDWGQMFQAENIDANDLILLYESEVTRTSAEIVHKLKKESENLSEKEIEALKEELKYAQKKNMVDFIVETYHIKNVDSLLEWFYENKTPKGYRGLTNEDISSNELRLCSIPKNDRFITVLSYNKDAYSTHCKDYKEYHNWLKCRNEERFRINTEHGKNYDSKNMYSCCRIMLTALELAKTGKFVLRRPNDRDFLLSVKKGDLSYDEIIKFADDLNNQMKEAMKTSTLAEDVDKTVLNNYILNVRIYQFKKFLNIEI